MEYTSLMGALSDITSRANDLASEGWIVQSMLATGAMIQWSDAEHEPQFAMLLCRERKGAVPADNSERAPVRRVIGRGTI